MRTIPFSFGDTDKVWTYYNGDEFPGAKGSLTRTLQFDFTNLPPEHVHYLGKNDGKIYFPLKQVWICMGNATKDTAGSVEFKEVKAIAPGK